MGVLENLFTILYTHGFKLISAIDHHLKICLMQTHLVTPENSKIMFFNFLYKALILQFWFLMHNFLVFINQIKFQMSM
jgi:hypothetical protein